MNIRLLTLQLLDSSTILLRLEHQFQVDEPPYNQEVTVSLDVSLIIQHDWVYL